MSDDPMSLLDDRLVAAINARLARDIDRAMNRQWRQWFPNTPTSIVPADPDDADD